MKIPGGFSVIYQKDFLLPFEFLLIFLNYVILDVFQQDIIRFDIIMTKSKIMHLLNYLNEFNSNFDGVN